MANTGKIGGAERLKRVAKQKAAGKGKSKMKMKDDMYSKPMKKTKKKSK